MDAPSTCVFFYYSLFKITQKMVEPKNNKKLDYFVQVRAVGRFIKKKSQTVVS